MSRPARLFVIFAAVSCGAPRSSGIDVPTLPPVVSAPASPSPGPRPAPAVGESPPLSSSPPPRARVRAIELGMFNGCALYEDGRVACWDRPALHVAGDVKIVEELPKVDRLHVGFHFACARAASDHALWCWGENDSGQLGRGSKSQKALDGTGAFDDDFEPRFVRVTELDKRYVSIAASRHETCAVSTEGDLTCIGSPDWRSALSRRRSNSPPRSAGSCTFFVVPPPKTYVPPKGGRVATSSSSSTVLPTSFTQARCSSVPEPGLTDITWLAATMGQRCTVHRDGAVRCVGDRIDGTGIDDDPVLLPIP